MSPVRLLLRTLPLAALIVTAPAVAEDGHGEPSHDVPGAHGTPGEHGAAGHGGEEAHKASAHGDAHGGGHGEGHGEGDHGGAHHVDYGADDDHDGTVNWLDPDAGEAYQITRLVQHAFNLLVIGGVLFWFARRPVADALRNRAHSIRTELIEAAKMRDEARQRQQEINARLGGFEAELARMRAQAEADAKADEEKLVARANNEAARIRDAAERHMRDELVRARVALRKEAVELAVQLAEQTLRSQVQSDDQRRLAREFLESLNREANHG